MMTLEGITLYMHFMMTLEGITLYALYDDIGRQNVVCTL